MWKTQQMQKLLICIFMSAALSGCFGFPGVYRIEVPQGNVVTQEMVNKLKPGMTQDQVRYILGDPLLTDTLNADRWDYLNSITDGHGKTERYQLTIHFNQGRLSELSGDFKPETSTTE